MVGHIRLAIFCLLLIGSGAFSQSTQPVSRYDDQPVRRNRTQNNETPPKPVENTGFDWNRLLIAMGIVLGLILILKWIVARMYPGLHAQKGLQVVRVLSRLPISPRQHLLILQVGHRLLIVGDSGGQLSTLSEIRDPDEVAMLVGQIKTHADSTTSGSCFAFLFGKAREDYQDPSEVSPIDPEPAIQDTQEQIKGLIDRMKTLTRAVRKE
ncbi:MAG: hypothetical protein KatS3mg104_1243 [Phycisphaerae bacterium]|nr:MAG: hypothetical protein KatS3mg104_1243 [Phycisphaerae bacterium]